MDVFAKVQKIIGEQLGVDKDKITMNAGIVEDLGADSLDVVDIVMTVEDEFGIEVKDEDIEKMVTVSDVVRYIEEKA